MNRGKMKGAMGFAALVAGLGFSAPTVTKADDFSFGFSYGPRYVSHAPVVYSRPSYVAYTPSCGYSPYVSTSYAPPTYYAPAPVVYERPVYYSSPVVYSPRPVYYSRPVVVTRPAYVSRPAYVRPHYHSVRPSHGHGYSHRVSPHYRSHGGAHSVRYRR